MRNLITKPILKIIRFWKMSLHARHFRNVSSLKKNFFRIRFECFLPLDIRNMKMK